MCISNWITPTVKQTWCAAAVLLGMVAQGMGLGFTSNILQALKEPDSPIKLDIDSASSFASAAGVTILISLAVSCFLMERCGRRYTFLLTIVPGMIGWLLTFLAQNYSTLIIARLLFGATLGSLSTVAVIVLAEYTSPQNRGMFLNLKTTLFSMGSMFAHIFGNFMHWRTIALTIMVPHILAFIIVCTWPESPSWLASKKKFEKCKKDFIWLRGNTIQSQEEINELIEAQKERLIQVAANRNFKRKVQDILRKFLRKDFLKPLAIAFTSYIVMEASGKHYFSSYALQIISNVTNAETNPYYYTLYIDIIITISSTCSSILIRIMKRRTLYFSTALTSLLALFFLCIFLYLVSINYLSKDRPWIVISLFLLYFFITNLGCTPMMMTIHGEIFPVAHREFGTTIIGVIMSLGFTGTEKIIPYMWTSLNVYGMFAVLGIVIGSMLLILYFILPETKDRTLQEIENYFTIGKFTKGNEDSENAQQLMITKS